MEKLTVRAGEAGGEGVEVGGGARGRPHFSGRRARRYVSQPRQERRRQTEGKDFVLLSVTAVCVCLCLFVCRNSSSWSENDPNCLTSDL